MSKNGFRTPSAVLERPRRTTREVWIEYPKKDEVVGYPTYSIQVATVPEAINVDVSIDQGEWRPCRESLGLWWYDWSGYEAGEHEVVARIRKDHDLLVRSEPRQFRVTLPAP